MGKCFERINLNAVLLMHKPHEEVAGFPHVFEIVVDVLKFSLEAIRMNDSVPLVVDRFQPIPLESVVLNRCKILGRSAKLK